MLTKHRRIKDRKVISACRKEYCEVCGRRANIEPHHIFTVGSGGGDIRENLIQLCTTCHIDAHSGNGESKDALLRVVAWRERKSMDEVYTINRQAMGYDV